MKRVKRENRTLSAPHIPHKPQGEQAPLCASYLQPQGEQAPLCAEFPTNLRENRHHSAQSVLHTGRTGTTLRRVYYTHREAYRAVHHCYTQGGIPGCTPLVTHTGRHAWYTSSIHTGRHAWYTSLYTPGRHAWYIPPYTHRGGMPGIYASLLASLVGIPGLPPS